MVPCRKRSPQERCEKSMRNGLENKFVKIISPACKR